MELPEPLLKLLQSKGSTIPEIELEQIEDRYTLREVLGEGRFSQVKLGIRNSTQQNYAIKVVDRGALEEDEEAMEAMEAEVAILKAVDHPNIVELIEVVKTPITIYLVMELLEGGELFDRIVSKGFYAEDDAKILVASLLQAVAYLHDLQIVHRDLKPENLLFAGPEESAALKIIDFGYAGFFSDDRGLTGLSGTPDYVAPEVLTWYGSGDRPGQPYDKSVDIWSLGVIIYILLCGFPPFYAEEEDELLDKVREGSFEFTEPYWTTVSANAKDMVSRCLMMAPDQRLTPRQALRHPWLAGAVSPDSAVPRPIKDTSKPRAADHALSSADYAEHHIRHQGELGHGASNQTSASATNGAPGPSSGAGSSTDPDELLQRIRNLRMAYEQRAGGPPTPLARERNFKVSITGNKVQFSKAPDMQQLKKDNARFVVLPKHLFTELYALAQLYRNANTPEGERTAAQEQFQELIRQVGASATEIGKVVG